MIVTRVADLLLMLLLAGSLAVIGQIVLGRRARDLFEWNRAFIIGSTLAAALLFPLSLAFGSHALTAELCIVLALAAWRVAMAIYRGQVRESLASLARPLGKWRTVGVPSQLALAAILLFVVCFAVLAFLGAYGWDGFQIWATKAMILSDQGRLTKQFLRGYGINIDRVVNYPPLLPLLEAFLSRLRWGFDWLAVKPVCLLFFVSLLLSTYRAGRALLSRPVALAVVTMLAALPTISGVTSFGGYADVPLAAIAALVLAESVQPDQEARGWRSPLAWSIAGLLTAKSEGVILLGITCVVVLLYQLVHRRRPWRSRAFWGASSVVVAAVLLRFGYLSWTGVPDPDFFLYGHLRLAQVLPRLAVLPRVCVRMLLAFPSWAIFWPAFAVASIALFRRARGLGRYLVLAVWMGLAAYSGVFLVTTWDMVTHIQSAYDRLLSHLAPVAAVCIGYAYELTVRPVPDRPPRQGPERPPGVRQVD